MAPTPASPFSPLQRQAGNRGARECSHRLTDGEAESSGRFQRTETESGRDMGAVRRPWPPPRPLLGPRPRNRVDSQHDVKCSWSCHDGLNGSKRCLSPLPPETPVQWFADHSPLPGAHRSCLSVNMTSGDLGLSHHVAQLGTPPSLAGGVPPNPCHALPTGCVPALTNTPTIRSVSFSWFLMPLPTNTTALAHTPSQQPPSQRLHVSHHCPRPHSGPHCALWPCYIRDHTAAQAGWGDQTPEKEDFRQHPSGSPTADTLIC
ncbi:uncharacterized protein LOC112583766 isoform X2 [Bubalus bubalis]|uniref:uncharacterized protein LOC112583766 isoform X2 n=1 Tax=Bubalus bubalis TaxID=89462 RepID=UPI001E1B932C|nr:uncharacterized protein LOC112583766 isoform X2 [Bubalus bubalis]